MSYRAVKSGRVMQITRTGLSGHPIEGDEHSCHEQFNRSPFSFSHHFVGHPLFELPRLLQLAKSMSDRPQDLYYDSGNVAINQRWDETPPCELPIDETIRRIHEAGAWIILKRAEKDPDYAVVLDECLSRIQELIGADLQKDLKVSEAIIFVTSPNRLTTYHIGRECNFLLQLQ